MVKFKYIILLGLYAGIINSGFAHEQWLLTSTEIEQLNNLPSPPVFSQLTPFNISIIGITLILLGIWIRINYKCFAFQVPINNAKLNWSLFFLRFFTGMMLILCALGFIPKVGIPYYTATLFAPDLIIPYDWSFLRWVEIISGILLIVGLFTRLVSCLLLLLIGFSFYLYGNLMLHYVGFYLAIIMFLLSHGGGNWSLDHRNSIRPYIKTLLAAQILTGANFLFSAIFVKFLAPNLTIEILRENNAITFGIPLPEFVFIMFVVEALIGIGFILGWYLRILSVFVFLLFIFLSFNLSENIFAHSFIYGLLITFIILEGFPICKPSNRKFHPPE